MVQAIQLAISWVKSWVENHSESFPPIVINITDGESTDGDPLTSLATLQGLSTSDGNVLVWNCHLSESKVHPVSFPYAEHQLPEDRYAKMMFSMSSELPEEMIAIAKEEYENVSQGARGYVFNAQLEDLIKLLDIGTRAVSSLMK